MLKFTYTETGFYLESLTQSLEELVTGRFILAMRLGDRLTAEPGTASFLLPADLPQLKLLVAIARRSNAQLTIAECDPEFVEISLRGIWLSAKPDSGEGIFLATPGDAIEHLIVEIWQRSFSCQSVHV